MKNVKLQVKSLRTAVVLYKRNIKYPNKTIIPKEIPKFIFDLKKRRIPHTKVPYKLNNSKLNIDSMLQKQYALL